MGGGSSVAQFGIILIPFLSDHRGALAATVKAVVPDPA